LTSVSGFRGQPGKVICYEVPDNAAFYKGTWKKHILSSSFPPTENYRRISPGGVYAFYPGLFSSYQLRRYPLTHFIGSSHGPGPEIKTDF